jgi:hypothetical protein
MLRKNADGSLDAYEIADLDDSEAGELRTYANELATVLSEGDVVAAAAAVEARNDRRAAGVGEHLGCAIPSRRWATGAGPGACHASPQLTVPVPTKWPERPSSSASPLPSSKSVLQPATSSASAHTAAGSTTWQRSAGSPCRSRPSATVKNSGSCRIGWLQIACVPVGPASSPVDAGPHLWHRHRAPRRGLQGLEASTEGHARVHREKEDEPPPLVRQIRPQGKRPIY